MKDEQANFLRGRTFTRYLLLLTHYLSLFTRHLLLSTHYSKLNALNCYILLVTCYFFLITRYFLLFTPCALLVTRYFLHSSFFIFTHFLLINVVRSKMSIGCYNVLNFCHASLFQIELKNQLLTSVRL